MSKSVLVISGSPRGVESLTHILSDAIASAVNKAGSEASVWKVNEHNMPVARPEFHKNPFADGTPEDVSRLAKMMDAADVLALCTPVYNGSYSAHLKNALDCMKWDAFRGKRIILASHGEMTAALPLNHLQDVVRTMQGTVVNSLIVVNRNDFDIESRTISNQQDIARIEKVVQGELSG